MALLREYTTLELLSLAWVGRLLLVLFQENQFVLIISCIDNDIYERQGFPLLRNLDLLDFKVETITCTCA